MIETRVTEKQFRKIFLKKIQKNLLGYQKGFYLCGPKRSANIETLPQKWGSYKEFIDRKEARK